MTRTAHQLPAGDPWMSALGGAAREHLHLLEQSAVGEVGPAVVKVPLRVGPGGAQVEHVWLGQVELATEVVRGELLNAPREAGPDDVVAGARLVVPRAEVEDWVLGVDGVALGGFTVQLVRLGLRRSARRRHDRAWGLRFPALDRVRLRPGEAEDAWIPLPLPGAS